MVYYLLMGQLMAYTHFQSTTIGNRAQRVQSTQGKRVANTVIVSCEFVSVSLEVTVAARSPCIYFDGYQHSTYQD